MIAWALITILGDPVHKLELNLWAHWDLNPDLRVSLRVIAPVYHQHQMTHI